MNRCVYSYCVYTYMYIYAYTYISAQLLLTCGVNNNDRWESAEQIQLQRRQTPLGSPGDAPRAPAARCQ